MTDLPVLEVDEFDAYFRAVHGHDPFPWQKRLALQVVSTESWPSVLDLPTGAGKTAALDIAVFDLALQAGRLRRASPLRIVYVVDRRTIVNQAHERALRISEALSGAKQGVLHRIAQRLSRYGHEDVPLRTAMLRGGIARGDMWARMPDQPLIAISTVDQVGSRLLFRGYGVTDSMKPIHAGLLGNDVLYLLDEVHLSQPFRETLAAVGRKYRSWAERPLPSPFVVVEMSATPGDSQANAFQLDEVDRQDPRLSPRLRSSKKVSLVSASARGFVSEAEKQVLSMVGGSGATVAAVVNRVKTARELHRRLSQAIPPDRASVHLLTGRMRPFDRDELERDLLRRIRAGRVRSVEDEALVVVATQTIEAGADFDFDGLVTECASLDALRQRFGRLDRLGELAGAARGVIVARTDSLKDDAVYGEAIGKTWAWLNSIAIEETLDFGIEALVLPEAVDDLGLLAPRSHAPVLLPSHLDAWVQTAPVPEPDPEVALWLHGPQRGLADVQIIWRADLTEALLQEALDSDAAAEVAVGMVEALPPVSAEAMSVSFLSAKRWLQGLTEPESADVEGAADLDEETRQEAVVRSPRAAMVWRGEESQIVRASDLRPGQTIVVPSSYGGIEHGNWDPESQRSVKDVAELASIGYGKRPALRLHQSVIRSLFETDVPSPQDAGESDAPDDRVVVLEWIARVKEGAEGQPAELLELLHREAKSLRVERLPLGAGDDAGEYFFVAGKSRAARKAREAGQDDCVTAEGTRSSFTGVSVTLADHDAGVAGLAAALGDRLGLPPDVVADLRLCGEWHDAGKADPRFQRWLQGGSEFKALTQPEPLAKGAVPLSGRQAMRRAREHAGYPQGGRHELMSVALMESAADPLATRSADWALVRHLVASHHGYCRPFAPWVGDPKPVEVMFGWSGVASSGSSDHRLERLDSGIADRFWLMVRRYGWWGLAWLEALLRLADHRQSEREQVLKEEPNG